MRRRVWFHRVCAIAWALTLPVALKWWPQSVLFVIVASVWANVYAPWSASEAADDREVMERLERIEAMLTGLIIQRDTKEQP